MTSEELKKLINGEPMKARKIAKPVVFHPNMKHEYMVNRETGEVIEKGITFVGHKLPPKKPWWRKLLNVFQVG